MSALSSKLLLKRMPCSLEELAQLIRECKLILPRSLNTYGRKRVLLEYSDPEEAAKALEQLQVLSESLDKPLCISVFGPRPTSGAPSASSKSTQTKAAGNGGAVSGLPDIDKYVRRLYACNNQCDFTQPPPPYLSYSYPPINGEILARIGQSLQTNPHFYNQVLHLMNRMNLEPPFEKRPNGLMVQMRLQHVGTQTELIPSESESELESDDGEQKLAKRQRLLLAPASEEARAKTLKRARQMLQQAAHLASHAKPKLTVQKPSFDAPKIDIKLPETLVPPSINPERRESISQPESGASTSKSERRLSTSQLEALPVYKNYKTGDPSNKLYIKNLAKTVDEQQLRDLYAKYTAASNLDIKVMQQGRMKGQAFVTFLDANNPEIIAQALNETNGLLWHDKPMIVCYGKQQ
ncbi:U11/U12 small nuclear ribonucleoprotein 65 kDa protein-like isoform X1 [Drosophila mauritiana]|uniref:U11/U12 small nuclear ribonucleoprotein 65 kDa protein-like isoform X1 n=1 Tax=Drosophila mauritiana TaxID=7226 RepID=A0A6P8JW50_DROMA|nr:U11/U12 small nuclear ribonucleoprotein 65 kDa protein-like isoform X1 [Drosophila mauritiana]